jgi:hypothetical protein
VPVKTGISPLHAGYFGVWSESAPEIETRWRLQGPWWSDQGPTIWTRSMVISYDAHSMYDGILQDLWTRTIGRITFCVAMIQCPSQDEGTREFTSTAFHVSAEPRNGRARSGTPVI